MQHVLRHTHTHRHTHKPTWYRTSAAAVKAASATGTRAPTPCSPSADVAGSQLLELCRVHVHLEVAPGARVTLAAALRSNVTPSELHGVRALS